MPRFIVERDIPGVGGLHLTEHQQEAVKSNDVLHAMGPQIQWVQSYITNDRIYGVYIAPDANTIREHAERSQFPASRISEVILITDPTTAEG